MKLFFKCRKEKKEKKITPKYGYAWPLIFGNFYRVNYFISILFNLF